MSLFRRFDSWSSQENTEVSCKGDWKRLERAWGFFFSNAKGGTESLVCCWLFVRETAWCLSLKSWFFVKMMSSCPDVFLSWCLLLFLPNPLLHHPWFLCKFFRILKFPLYVRVLLSKFMPCFFVSVLFIICSQARNPWKVPSKGVGSSRVMMTKTDMKDVFQESWSVSSVLGIILHKKSGRKVRRWCKKLRETPTNLK